MDFTYTDEQNDIKQLSNKILQEQVTIDSHKKLEEEMKKGAPRFDGRLWATVADAGLLGIALAEEYGGMGFSFMELSLFLEEVGRVVAPIPAVPSTISALAIQKFGDKELKAVLGGTVTGEVILTTAFSEPAVQDALDPAVKATKDGNSWKISGVKLCVPYAKLAHLMLVTAATDKGPAVFVVDPKIKGVTINDLIATSFEPQAEVVFDGAVAKAQLGGADAVKYLVEHYTAAVCAHQIGVTDAAMRLTSSYVSEREQFGRKIGTFQAVGHRAANQFIDVGCLRLVTQQAGSMLSEGGEAEM